MEDELSHITKACTEIKIQVGFYYAGIHNFITVRWTKPIDFSPWGWNISKSDGKLFTSREAVDQVMVVVVLVVLGKTMFL